MKKLLKGLFFWNKKKTETEKFKERIETYMSLVVHYAPLIRKIAIGKDITSPGEMIGRMYDFYELYTGVVDQVGGMDMDEPVEIPRMQGIVAAQMTVSPGLEPPKEKQAVKPKDVINELDTIPSPISLEKIDKKISILNDKRELLEQKYAIAQINGMVKRLENRKGYEPFQAFYSRFPNTTDERIHDLLKKYKLEFNKSDLFIPTFPDEAIEIMREYNKITVKSTGEKAVFYVIAEQSAFEEKRKRLDPILLAQSPFGFYWQILGAWDKEMILLSEL